VLAAGLSAADELDGLLDGLLEFLALVGVLLLAVGTGEEHGGVAVAVHVVAEVAAAAAIVRQ
jgi:hypothetical protein